jgi:hypothetical protein
MVFQELRTVPWLSAFRIVQNDPASVRLQVVLKSEVEQDTLKALVAQASALMNDELAVYPEVVDKLERDKSGKLRAVVCTLPLKHKATSLPQAIVS